MSHIRPFLPFGQFTNKRVAGKYATAYSKDFGGTFTVIDGPDVIRHGKTRKGYALLREA